MSEILLGKFFMEDDLDGKYSTGEIIDVLGDKFYLLRYSLSGEAAGPLAITSLDQLAALKSNGQRCFHLFESRDALKQCLVQLDGEADVLCLS